MSNSVNLLMVLQGLMFVNVRRPSFEVKNNMLELDYNEETLLVLLGTK